MTPDHQPRFAHPVVLVLLAIAAGASVVGRFLVPSALWLDEALSVNISSLPISEIPAALKRDGHPPLYYVLLHGWIEVFGDGDRAVRAFSGVTSLAIVPLAWAVGRRLGRPRLATTLAVVVLLSPYVLRYGSETRMYALVMALVFGGYLVVDRSLERARPADLVGVALVTAALLWTHYWSMWLVATVASLVGFTALRRSRTDRRSAHTAWATLGALVAGGLAFLPWLPTLAYQSAHTGTPWAEAFRPATLIITSLTDFGGGPYGETQVLAIVLVILAFLGATGIAVDEHRIDVDLRGQPEARVPLVALAGTASIASLVGLATGMAFHPRYAAVFFPLAAILVALGVDRFERGLPRDLLLGTFAVLSTVGIVVVFTLDRSQSREVAEAVERLDRPSLVVTCPDQLGPAVERAVRQAVGTGAEVVAYPRLDSARLVDWVDYAERNAGNDPVAVATGIAAKAGDRPIVLVFGDDYRTLEGQCSAVANHLATIRPLTPLVRARISDFYEPMTALGFGIDD